MRLGQHRKDIGTHTTFATRSKGLQNEKTNVNAIIKSQVSIFKPMRSISANCPPSS